jgi:asparagine synthase (glutamine-hydrolysing)
MGALVAAVTKKKHNIKPTVVMMQQELSHRGNDGYGTSTYNTINTGHTLEKLNNNTSSNVALGHNLSYILTKDRQQPVQGNGFTAVFEGRFYPSPNPPEMSEAQQTVKILKFNPLQNADSILQKKEGSYVFAIAQQNKIIAGRDFFGATPLYYGENGIVCAIASEQKALWKIGIQKTHSFPPGQLAIITEHGFSFHKVKELKAPPKEKIDIETATRALQLLLLDAIRKQVSDIESVAVAFSGGVDSSIVAALAKHVGIDVQLISVGLEDQKEVMFTEEAAEALDMPINVQTYKLDELEETLTKVLWLTEETNPVNACIAIPFFWLAETAKKLGHPILLAGQGADELFGGYQRYLTEYKKDGKEAVEQRMFFDIKNAYSANFQRDNQVCSYHKIELRLPFIDRSVIDFALRLPFRFKINSKADKLRKHILRKVAQDIDVPRFMSNKPKKAVQYTTGVTKALQQLAKNNNQTLREYIKQKYNTIYPPEESN